MATQKTWDDLVAEINVFLESHFFLDSPRDKTVWQYIIGAAAHLEYVAIAVLWVADGTHGDLKEYEQQKTLGQAVTDLKKRAMLPADVLGDLRAIADLRNAVAHRSAVFGLTGDPMNRRAKRGRYKGRHVFSDPEALRQLMHDVNRAAETCRRWIDAHAGGTA
jgi:hypothetical protein